MKRVNAMEELEFHAPPSERLIERRYHDVAHPGRHLPEDRTLVLEQDKSDQEDHDPGGDRRPLGIGLLVAEHQVVQTAHEGRLEHIGMAAVTDYPVAELFIVDGPETLADG